MVVLARGNSAPNMEATMAVKKKTDEDNFIQIKRIENDSIRICMVSASPMIMHRFAFKAWQELLLPSQKKNAAAKAESLKHDPLNEYRECVYLNRSETEPTAIHYPAGAFSKALAAAALDLPGASKAQILRLVGVLSTQINIYGVPTLGMDMVRSSDMARTPDVRTRAYFPEWACTVEVSHIRSLIGPEQIVNLMDAAGKIVGIGDYRPQKGGAFGRFEVVDASHPDFVRITTEQGRGPQEAALQSPEFFNEDSAELFGWFIEETARREKTVPSTKGNGKAKKQPTVVPVQPTL
jgi:hypothetical protein